MNYFLETFKEAQKARPISAPNPAVGAVIVKNKKIIGRGHTGPACSLHAEARAIKKVKFRKALQGAQMYSTLTPCSHFGRTPPCTDLIIASGIKRLHLACHDPHLLAGKNSLHQLKKKGIKVAFDYPQEMREKLFELNEGFFFSVTRKRPFIAVKYAMTLDGKIASRTYDAKWISSKASRERAHCLRSLHDAVMIGAGTCVKDNPILNVRLKSFKGLQPKRLVLDLKNEVPLKHKVFTTAGETIMIVPSQAPQKYLKAVAKTGKGYIAVPLEDNYFNLKKTVQILQANLGINSILVEGGAGILGSFLDAGLIDKVHVFIAPRILGDGRGALSPFSTRKIRYKIAQAVNIPRPVMETIGEDIYLSGYLDHKQMQKLKQKVLRCGGQVFK